jgi:hypothetical protein
VSENPIRSDVPIERLTHLTVEMTAPLERPENDDIKAIVFLHDGTRSGIQIHGYEDQTEAMVDLFLYMRTLFKSMGKDLEFIGVPESPEGLDG